VSNRYLSAIKNSYLPDLPRLALLIAAHCAARTARSPRVGLALMARIVRLAPRMWRKRRPPALRRREMLAWFRWSRAQPTAAPTTWRARLRASRR
jgi:hypothetical protein